jgi:enoyl-CoA hydratase/carnithine racemase
MPYDTIQYTLEDHIAAITLDQPERHNPLSHAAATELTTAFRQAQADDDARVVLLTGAGESFSAGGNIEEFTEFQEQRPTEIFEEGKATAELFQLLAGYETPLVTAVNGHALGGGCGLVAASHLAYAAEDALLGTTEITLGLFPLVILPALRATVGDQRTLEMALTGERLSASDAANLGLVTEAVTDGDVRAYAREVAETIAGWSPMATSLGLQAFYETADMPAEKAIDTLNTYRVLFYTSHDLHEGAQAFLDDRDPDWQGY